MAEKSMAASAAAGTDGPPRGIADLPGPRGVPLLGSARQIDSKRFHQTLENWAREYGPVYKFRVPGRLFMVVSDRDVIASILRDRPDMFRRSSRTASMLEEAGTRGLFTAEGEEWRRQRKLAMRALTPEVVHRFFPTLVMMTERLLARWRAILADGRQVDVLRDLKAYTLDVTIGLAMGQDINTLEHEDNPLQRDIEFLFGMVARRLTAPFAYWRLFKLGVDREAQAAHGRIQRAVTGFIAEARARLQADPALRGKPSNMLEALVAARDEPDSGFTDAEVIGNAITMVFAGEDTTSNSIAWLLHLLSRHPDAARAAADEACAVLGADTVPRDHHLLDSLPYIDAANREAMRLKPVAPFMAAEPNVDTVVDGVRTPAGTIIFLLLRHAAERGGDFAHPERFDPTRWLHAAEAAMDPGRKLFPFGGGPRFCPGRYLAIAEIKMVMAMMMRNFTLALQPGAAPVEERFTFTMTPSALPVLLSAKQP
ncbi:cytochrome P450 [Pseudoduganella namucuonensis]|uniref:Cytochrome P450 n=1 Tax=Pseudoduganella namucuonensis TaxID=1035707 RepID=A0A1I7JKT0_9BURK|nr:cytochrome P450 [Pseudoduganella namucuonensis]SFU85738.1 Cytochrome P450 [Pseudoduganella namucuonensis]